MYFVDLKNEIICAYIHAATVNPTSCYRLITRSRLLTAFVDKKPRDNVRIFRLFSFYCQGQQ